MTLWRHRQPHTAPTRRQRSAVPLSRSAATRAPQVQQCTLMSIKTGGCPEDCGYCSQSSKHKDGTGLKATKLADLGEVDQARCAPLAALCAACRVDTFFKPGLESPAPGPGPRGAALTPRAEPWSRRRCGPKQPGRRASAWAPPGGALLRRARHPPQPWKASGRAQDPLHRPARLAPAPAHPPAPAARRAAPRSARGSLSACWR